jgi:Ala-tRNA(Pro) deacylase
MNSPILQSIQDFLHQHGIDYRSVHHRPTYTSEESAAARNESIHVGGKALVIKVDNTFNLFVLRASLRADSKKIRTQLQAKRSRFATPQELKELTGLVPGSVPPFGEPILPLSLHVDTSITSNDKIAFNAGSLTDSIILSVEDYLTISQPTVFSFSQE